jgi:hypothetical protein
MVPSDPAATAIRLLAFMATAAIMLAACSGDPDPSPASAAAAPDTLGACAETPIGSAELSKWTDELDAPNELVAVIVSSQVSVGPSRLLYTVTDPGYQVVASQDIQTRLKLFALDRDKGSPALEADGAFLDTGTGRGLYRANVAFPCSGTWGAEVTAVGLDGASTLARTMFRVADAGSTPAIGAPAPRSDSLTASTLEEVRKISTDPEPALEAYQTTVAETVTSGNPSVVFFATPAFCQSGVCGPTVEMVKAVVAEYGDELEHVTVEPYKLMETANGLQPELDQQGRLQPVQAVLDYGIAVEPYLFVVDAQGNVAAKFEVVVDEDELRGALEDVTQAGALTSAS